MGKIIEAVLKVTERCNINCTYCYMFNKGDGLYLKHPPYISKSNIELTAGYLAEGAVALSASKVTIYLHGGEPCLMKKHRFIEMCEILKETIEPVCSLDFGIQTNAMLIDDEWIEIFSRYNISVGVSIDGPKEINDRVRIGHKGQGTYDRTVAGLRLLTNAWNEGLLTKIGLIAVVNPLDDATKIYKHLVHELGLSSMNFLLPIDSHDSFDSAQNKNIGKFLCDIFDSWIEDNDPHVDIRLIKLAVGLMLGGNKISSAETKPEEAADERILITIASNGDVEDQDDLRPINIESGIATNIASSTLVDRLRSSNVVNLRNIERTIPDNCKNCCWVNVCRGGVVLGGLINRYSASRGFNNSSIMCEAFQDFYSHVAAYLLKNRIDFETLSNNLLKADSKWLEYTEPCLYEKASAQHIISAREIA